ncbi:BON domain-containing protein [Halopseudomonas salegens]|uniref:Hyperosmotically inducible protein n=1 Tax=Halopseudomonas salegens TaxID=1434072 RepID=A0A1H2F417_9GAMM|nr:BON domain-containing protein [Halopseudomonas salegens]SDU02126.1 hyperosmotically inducible protein [Halopseudomonas salegens]
MKQLTKGFAIATVAATALGLSAMSSVAVADDHDMSDKTESTMESAAQATSDTWITSKVLASFAADAHVSVFDLDADTKEGVVTLTGEVNTSAERALAKLIAKGIDGVKDVDADGVTVAEE